MAEGGAAIALLGGEPAPLWRLSRASRWASPWPERPGRGAARSGKYSGHRAKADAGGRVRRDLSAHPARGRADRRVRGPSGPAAERPGAGSTAATARRRTPEGEYDVTYPRTLLVLVA